MSYAPGSLFRGIPRGEGEGTRYKKGGVNPVERPTSSDGIRTVLPRKWSGRPSGKHHLLWQRALRANHHGHPFQFHSGDTTSMRQPSRHSFATTSSRRLKVFSLTGHPRAGNLMHRRTHHPPLSRRLGTVGWWAWRRREAKGRYTSGRTPTGLFQVGPRSPLPPISGAMVCLGWLPRRRKTGVTPPYRYRGILPVPGTRQKARDRGGAVRRCGARGGDNIGRAAHYRRVWGRGPSQGLIRPAQQSKVSLGDASESRWRAGALLTWGRHGGVWGAFVKNTKPLYLLP